MKKTTTILLTAVIGTSMLKANIVSKEVAENVATNFYQRNISPSVSAFTLSYTETAPNGDPVYYAFNADGNKGFVIVSAEDAGTPIIGYSGKGLFVMPEHENNFTSWMSKRKAEIINMRAHALKATDDIANTWNNYSLNKANGHNFKSAVNTYMCQTEWDQEYPYNTDCPIYYYGNAFPTYTGCVATAMAQVMKYWNFPPNGTGQNSYTFYDNPFGTLTMNFSGKINWSNMVNAPTTYSPDIAGLMEELGYSVDMTYSADPYVGSGAWVTEAEDAGASAQNSYSAYFYYNNVTAVSQSAYTASAWIALIENEFIANRPVQYVGFTSGGAGHSWVADGYNSSNDFHMNWGWGDTANGWFLPTNLNPTFPGGSQDFTANIGALIGIQPSNQPFINYTAGQQPVYCNPSSGTTNIGLNAYDYYSPNVTFTWTISGTTLGGATITPSGTNNINAVVSITPTTKGSVTITLTSSVPTGSTGFTTRSTTTTFWVGAPEVAPTTLTYAQAGKTCYFNAEVNAVSGATAYQWSTNGSFPAPSAGGTPTPVTTGADYDPLTYYIIYARGVNVCGAGPTSIKFDKETPGKPPGACLEDPIKINNDGVITDAFKLFPDPASTELTIQYTVGTENTSNVNIDVYDMLGKKVESWTLPANENSATENVSGLAKGMYIYMITSGDNILQRGKVMIQR